MDDRSAWKLTLGQRAKLVLKAAFSDSGSLSKFLPSFMSSPYGTPPVRGTADYLRAYNDMPWIQAVANKISFGIAAAEWHLYKAKRKPRTSPDNEGTSTGSDIVSTKHLWGLSYGARESMIRTKTIEDPEIQNLQEVPRHPMITLMSQPNTVLSGLALMRLTQIYLDLVGEAFWLKERDGLGTPSQLWPLPPHWIIGTPLPTRPYFTIGFQGKTYPIPSKEVVWFYNPSPDMPYGRGVGAGHALADEMETDEYASKHTKSWFYNRARPDLIIYGDNLNPADTARLEADWLNKNQGFWKQFKPYFLNKQVTIKELTHTFENMQLVQLRTSLRDTIIQVYGGLPPEMLGILESSNRSTIDAADYLFARWILIPRLEQLRATLQFQLVPDYDDRLLLHYSSPVVEDRAHTLNIAKAAPWSLMIDEWRELTGHGPLAGRQGKMLMMPGGFYGWPISENGELLPPIVPQSKPTAKLPDGSEDNVDVTADKEMRGPDGPTTH